MLGLVDVSVPADGSAGTGDSIMVDASPVPQPVAFFNFNGNHKEQVSGVPASCTNCPSDDPAGGAHGGALAFDGSTDCLQFPPSGAFQALSTFTIAVWFKDASDTSYPIVQVPYAAGSTSYDSWQIDTDTSTTIRFTTNLNGNVRTTQLSAAFALKQWHHVAGTFDGRQLELFVDGVPLMTFSDSVSGISYDTVPVVYIGCDLDNGVVDRFFAGSLDDFYVFDSVLTKEQIAYLATP